MTEHRTPISVPVRMSDKDFMQIVTSSSTFGPSFAHIIERRPGMFEPLEVEEENSIRASWVWEYSFSRPSEFILAKCYLSALNEPFEAIWDASDFDDDEPEDAYGRYMIVTNYNAHENFDPELCPDCGNKNSGGHFADCPQLPEYMAKFPNGTPPIPPRLRTQARVSLGRFNDPSLN